MNQVKTTQLDNLMLAGRGEKDKGWVVKSKEGLREMPREVLNSKE